MEKLLTTRQVAAILNVSLLETVYSYIREGRLKAFKIGGNGKSRRHWRVRESDLEAFINGSVSQAGAELVHTEASNKSVRDGE